VYKKNVTDLNLELAREPLKFFYTLHNFTQYCRQGWGENSLKVYKYPFMLYSGQH